MNTNKNNDSLEQLFKNGLENAKVTAPKSVWQGVSAGINTGASASTVAGGLISASTIKIVAAVLLLSTISILVFNKKNKADNKQQKNINNLTNTETIKGINKVKNGITNDHKKIEVITQNAQTINPKNKATKLGQSNKTKLNKTTTTKINPVNIEANKHNSGIKEYNGKTNTKQIKESKNGINAGTENIVNSMQDTYCPGQVISFKSNKKMKWMVNGVPKGEYLEFKFPTYGVNNIEVRAYSTIGYSKTFIVKCIKPNAENFIITETNNRVFDCQYRGDKSNNCTWYFNQNQIKTGINTLFKLNNAECSANLRLIVSQQNCRDTSEKTINPKNIDILPWEVLTIGNDNLNDKLEINAECVDIQHFKIINMHGKIIYQSQDKNPKWDGKCNGIDCPKGQYYAIVHYRYNGEEQSQKGKITLK